MKFVHASPVFRKLIWRLGRKIYTYARGEGINDPQTNGEYWLLDQVLNTSSDSQVLLDVGANKGDWTARALSSIPKEKELCIHAFEPSLATRTMLSARFAKNPAVIVQPFGLSDRTGEAVFYSDYDGAGTNSLSPSSGSRTERVTLRSLDNFLDQSGIVAISMTKIDTEGFDLCVLKGAEKSLREGRIDVVQFEYNWRWLLNHACLRDVFDFISDKPYRFGKLVGEAIEFYEHWHFELDRYFENNYVLVRSDSELLHLGSNMHFNQANVATFGEKSRTNV